jgi:amidophosphoribosyltransferase
MCGVVGLVMHSPVNQSLFDALTMLQHRGQDAAGMVTYDGKKLAMRKDNGLVRDVFRTRHMRKLLGNAGIGHVRYPTAGSSQSGEAQPFYVNSPFGISLAHNGNLTNAKDLKAQLFKLDRRHINTDSDSEILLNVFAHELQSRSRLSVEKEDVFAAVSGVHQHVKGAYAVVSMITGYGVVAFRDPLGIRPLVLGKRVDENGKNEYIVASESIALSALDFEVVRDILPGEAVYITLDGEAHFQQCAEAPKLAPCLFEYVYFARPDSTIDGVSVHKSRLRMGKYLAELIRDKWSDVKFDVVIPVPDTSRTVALSLAHNLDIPYSEGFIRNRYIARTFIMPGQKMRQKSVRQKLNPVEIEFEDKDVLIVDDSIVRGTTSQQIVEMARNAGARKVYFASAAPPVRFPNVYGIDMPAVDEFIAHNRSEEEIGEFIGADGIIFQDLEDLRKSVLDKADRDNIHIEDLEASCFNGDYLTGDISETYLANLQHLRADAAKDQSDADDSSVIDIQNHSA